MPKSGSSLLANIPFARQLFAGTFDDSNINPKYDIFDEPSVTKDEKIQRLSVVNEFDNLLNRDTAGGLWVNTLAELIYSTDTNDKARRLQTYRTMGTQAEVADAIREICDEFIVKDESGKIMQFALRGDYSEEVREIIKDEFYHFMDIFKLEENGWQMMRDFITEGEIYFENVVSKLKPELGVIGLRRVGAERIDPFYYDTDNELIEFFVLKKKMYENSRKGGRAFNYTFSLDKKQHLLFLNEKQITYFHSHDWDEGGKRRYKRPHLDYGVRPYRHLSLIEDATIIYMLVRAPERLVFNIDTGSLPPGKAEAYVKKQMAEFWQRKTVGQRGNIENLYDPMTMLENYYFPKPRNGDGSTVTSIGGGAASPDNMDMLTLFINRLYKALQVPLARLNAETTYSDGMDVTREELRFARFVIRLQQLFVEGIKSTFITHLKLKGRKLTKLANHFGIGHDDQTQNVQHGSQINGGSSTFKEAYDFSDWNVYDAMVHEVSNAVEKEIGNLQKKIFEGNQRLEEIDREVEQLDEVILETHARNRKLRVLKEEHSEIMKSLGFAAAGIEEFRADSESIWTEYNLREEDVDMEFNKPSQFFALKEQQIFNVKFESYASLAGDDLISTTLAQKLFLGWSDKEIVVNREHLKKDAALRWELANIESAGPDFREKLANEMMGGGMEGGPMGPPGGGPMGGPGLPPPGGDAMGPAEDTTLPEFGGGAPPTGEDITSQELGDAGGAGPVDMPDIQ